jgi:cytochrome c biogenesis protein CcmG/thiol:disulfide interchange protein DsbE
MKPITVVAIVLTAGAGLALLWHLAIQPTRPLMVVGHEVPTFSLPPVEGVASPGFSTETLRGQVSIINVFASWCGPCRQEHPFLVALKRDTGVQILGINFQDLPENAGAFLAKLGNPYDAVGSDPNREISNLLGVVGLPHTFVVDGDGRLVFSHPGPLTEKSISLYISKHFLVIEP